MSGIIDDRQAAQSRRKLLLLAALFIGPVVVAYVLFFVFDWRPQGSANKGELVQPPRVVPQQALSLADGTLSKPDVLRGKWTWVYVGDGACDLRCRTALADTRQARLLLAEKSPRVQRLFLASGACCDLSFFRAEHPGLVVAKLDPNLANLFTLHDVSPEQSGRIYLIDPLGNLMMSYAPDAPNMGLLDDIKKLLKLSHIG